MGIQSVLCPVCQGVLPANGKESYTPARGRLIVTNGYCPGGCVEEQARQQAQLQAQQQTQQVARPQPSPAPAPVAGAGRGAGRAPLRVVR